MTSPVPASSAPEGAYVACTRCSLFTLCLPVGTDDDGLAMLERIMQRPRPLRRGEWLFRRGDPFRALFVVRSGALKSCVPMDGAAEHVIGFHLPGELLGLDAISAGAHGCAARALSVASVCRLPFDRLQELGAALPSLQQQMLRILCRQVFDDHGLQVLHGRRQADARLAAFIANLAARFRRRGLSGHEFRLSMSRDDIGSYLGLAKETVCRLLARLEDDGLVAVRGKWLHVRDGERLRARAGVDGAAQA